MLKYDRAKDVLRGLEKSFAIIEFEPDGRIITANELFCATMGYRREELVGKHHSLFADPAYAGSADYRAFWTKLGRGEFDSGEYKRLANGGREVWLQASYTPEASARKISQIIGVIDEIAFQTNLLALNAGVEAARAGDAGRGFAVVASEVRSLAQRSAEAAKEIKTLISASTQQVEQGVELVGQTGKALERIVSRVAEITTLVADISASAQEQATGLAEVNTAVNQMDQVTQQNAAMVEESTAASHSLAHEAGELTRLVARFRTGTEVAQAANAPPPRRGQPAPRRQAVMAMKPMEQAAPRAEEDNWEEF